MFCVDTTSNNVLDIFDWVQIKRAGRIPERLDVPFSEPFHGAVAAAKACVVFLELQCVVVDSGKVRKQAPVEQPSVLLTNHAARGKRQ